MDDVAYYRFGVVVRQRRKELGLTQRQVTRHGGPSGPTMSNIERAVAHVISPEVLAKLDSGLGWTDGSAARALAGGVPICQDTPTEQSNQPVPEASVALPITIVATLLDAARSINELVAGDVDVVVIDRIRRHLDELDSAIDPVLRRYITGLLETHARTDSNSPLPVQLAAIEHLLDTRSVPEPTDFDDSRYRRWLVGHRAHVDLATETRYRRRLHSPTTQHDSDSEDGSD
jgi:transcriptional regulator with XRE-family HTH domain